MKGKKDNLITDAHCNKILKGKKLVKNTPSLKMAGMALKGQYNLVSIMVPPRGVYERKIFIKEQKYNVYCLKIDHNVGFLTLLMDNFC